MTSPTEIQARLDAATPGPWERYAGEIASTDELRKVVGQAWVYRSTWELVLSDPDADLIANAPTDLAYLLTQLASAEARIAKALECYEPDPTLRLGESRWRSADEFLVAIRAALTEGSDS